MASLLHHLKHWFTPHPSNNYRARLLQNGSIFVLILLTIGVSVFIRVIESSPLHILGFNSSVTIDQVVAATNNQRLTAGLPPLQYSSILSDAASRKASNMLEENYWSHNSPSGKNPWVWFNAVGYKYTYAGENLAKDFGSTDRMMDAWMSSPTHRENIISDKYKEIGVAVVPGSLLGTDTVLVVQLFGTKNGVGGQVPEASPVESASTNVVDSVPIVASTGTVQSQVDSTVEFTPQPPEVFLIDQTLLKRIAGISMGTLFLLALILDLVISESTNLSRRVGKNWGHIVVINVVLLLVTIAHIGSIL